MTDTNENIKHFAGQVDEFVAEILHKLHFDEIMMRANPIMKMMGQSEIGEMQIRNIAYQAAMNYPEQTREFLEFARGRIEYILRK